MDYSVKSKLGIPIEEIRIGDTASFGKTLTEADVYQFTGIIGNFNPTHVNKVFAEKTGMKSRTVPQMLVAGFVSKILGTQYPGNGTIHIAQDLEFIKPVYIGDTVETTVKVTKIDGKTNRVWLDLYCYNEEGEKVLTGEAEIIPPFEVIEE
ncbi:MAG: MaoC family dehydratase [Gammaproteobacteria bacterium]|nr:MAG: MaoC family dehydratase [Gammaproteobacteria bacterium]